MVTKLEGEIRLGIVGAPSAYLAQIQEWVTEFCKIAVHVEVVSASGVAHCDLCLLVVEVEATTSEEVRSSIRQMGLTPCLVLATCDDDSFVDAALTAGAIDFLVWESLDATRLERSVQFAVRRQAMVGALTAREGFLAAAREQDCLQLANMLHDGPLQDLIGARFLLGALSTDQAVDDIQNSLQSVIQEVRSICSELKPPALAPFGLEKAIRAHMQAFHARYANIEVTLELDVDHLLLPEWVRLALFRIFQAALLNVDRHAQATQVWVRLRLDDQHVRLTVADDGQAFEVPDSWLDFAQTGRCGLLMMQERADALRGQLMVQSTPGSGTRVMVRVPLQQPPVPSPRFLAPTARDSTTPDDTAPDEAAPN